ncbi:hypothetical protein NE897_07830 [Yersinia ruckeri]|uniref:Uncharacterized protein n=1 Tax=Yersinia ruckeri TaxID=29486 RepID=A0A085U4C5_YERRU|nr:hypothetical protein [Yersinia ruckeri]AJI94909.1 hypothetical protein BD65_3115 [Yersinia ruckeri]AKA39719.1 hypothetical protein UGYR_15905 [Yersinia ruckeri]ARZ01586.1 hypothetical protein QMA0440_02254 [Yersinia ruckeri]AUQ43563.1 hypothetical protein NJ56_17510 [Yersinia ruckeri]EEQ00677.1 hypothetical protein yruck0001_18950 [Yersinia ruckeri ATCC 29473]
MQKKLLIALFAVMALSSLGGVFLAGLNMYTRSTTPLETETASSPLGDIAPAGMSNQAKAKP